MISTHACRPASGLSCLRKTNKQKQPGQLSTRMSDALADRECDVKLRQEPMLTLFQTIHKEDQMKYRQKGIKLYHLQ